MTDYKSKLSETRIVFLGSKGFVASAIIKKCKFYDIPILELSRNEIDLSKENASEKLSKILNSTDIVLAAAAKAPVKNMPMFMENIKIINQIEKALKSTKIKYLLNISSDAVYQDSSKPLTEKSFKAPTSLHGIMHLTRETVFEGLEINSGNLRPTLIYGPNDPHNGYGPNQFARLVKNNQEIKLFGKGEERRDHIYIDDVAQIALEMMALKFEGSLNAASGVLTSFYDVAKECLNVVNKKNEIIFNDRKGPMPHNGYRAFDISYTKSIIKNFNPITLSKGIEKLF